MLVLTIGIALLAGRAAGTTAAATSALLYLSAHGQPRFATTTTDPTTIRLGLLLGLVGAVGTFWVTVRHPRQVLQTGDSTTTRSRQEGQRP